MSDATPTWEQRLRWELHSLTRYPPIAVDDEAADSLRDDGLIERHDQHPVDTALGIRTRPRPGGTRRFRLTDTGRQRLRQTAEVCRVPHCPCHRLAPEPA